MGRKSGTGLRSAALVTIGALAGFGCEGTPEDDFYGPVVYDVLPEATRGPFALEFAFADGEPWQYVDVDPGLGSFNDLPGKVYVMKGVEGQFPIIDALPGDLEYSPFWEIIEVDPPSGYKANQIKSLRTIEDFDLKQTPTGRIMHCPVVDPDAAWTSNLGVPLEALGLPAMPAQVIWNVGDDMPNAFGEYLAQFGIGPADFFGFVGAPDEASGWPGFEFSPEFVALAEMRADKNFLTDADASPLDVNLQPVWHKRLRGFCLPDAADSTYATEADEFGDVHIATFGEFFLQFSPGQPEMPGDPEAEPPVEPTPAIDPAPYGNLPIYNAAPGAAGYSPVVFPTGVVTTDPAQVTDAADLNADNILGPIGDPIHAPLVRQIAPATVAGGE